jgi:hypothetical protein
MINVAYLEHGDEGFLAAAYIFVFHFFHTHLRPEAFPIDLSMFVGGMPLEKFKETRPGECRRLTESGELEKYLMPPPTESTVRLAIWFGWISIAVGLVLAGILFYSAWRTYFA